MIPNENGHFGHSTHTIFLYFFAIFLDSTGQIFSQIPHPALSMLKLSPAMAAALPRSISFVTTALTIAVLIELNGDDLRRDPLQVRKATLASILAKAGPGIRFNEHIEGDGPTVFAHACKMGLEGIMSKRKDSAYRSGRSPDWLKMKNLEALAVKREAEEDWSKERGR
jgi:hypothetical protein